MTQTVGRSSGGKAINLSQLEDEFVAAGVNPNGLGMAEEVIFTYDGEGAVTDFAEVDQPVVDQAITAHVAMRYKTDQEYAAEFQNPETPPERKQDIRDITAGLLPREQVPVTQEEWDKRMVGVG